MHLFRPILLVQGVLLTVIGGAMFVPAALLTMPTGRESVDDAYRQFVIEPGEFVYKRGWRDF